MIKYLANTIAALGLFLVVTCLTGCASLPKPSPEWSERRPVNTTTSSWTHSLAPAAAAQPGNSGIRLLRYGHDALSARLALADTAEHSLDIQYYIWRPDAAGRLLAEHVLRAADRGVWVRLLLDDIGGSASDEVLMTLDGHTNIEVRLFNPIANRTFRTLSLVFNAKRLTHRMHNKSFTVDNAVTIVGGRNVEDCYYAAGDRPHFADFDVLAAGPVAGDVAAMFDRYWFSTPSIPIYALTGEHSAPGQLEELRASLAASAKTLTNSPEFNAWIGNETGAEVRRREPTLVWGPVRLVCDLPEKIMANPSDTSTHLLPELRGVAEGTKHELIVVSPYFVPGHDGVAFFRRQRDRGVRVVLLSNSLAANIAPMHVGYRRYRKDLLRAGAEMWELKPDARVRASARGDDSAHRQESDPPGSSLHAKSFVFDRQTLFVGSLNLDPHSMVLNTEMGLIIEIPKLARTVAETLEANLAENAYRVKFVPGPGPCKECGSLEWINQENGEEVRYTGEPQATFSQNLLVFLLSFLPIESQL